MWKRILAFFKRLFEPKPVALDAPWDYLSFPEGKEHLLEFLIQSSSSSFRNYSPLISHQFWTKFVDALVGKKDGDQLQQNWKRLQSQKRIHSYLSWSEVGDLEQIFEYCLEFILRFQYEEMIIDEADEYPASWGAVSSQAILAAYNIAAMVRTTINHNDGAVNVVQHQRVIEGYFRAASSIQETKAGDLLILHALFERLLDLNKRVRLLKENQIRRFAFRTLIQTPARTKTLLNKRIQSYILAWQYLSPLSFATTSYQELKNPPPSFSYHSIIANKKAVGLQYWLIRQMLQIPVANAQTQSLWRFPKPALLLMNEVAQILAAPKEEWRLDHEWQVVAFLGRLYRLFTHSLPLLATFEKTNLLDHVANQTAYERLLNPFNPTYRAIQELRRKTPVNRVEYQEILKEFDWMNQALLMEEAHPLGDRFIQSQREKFILFRSIALSTNLSKANIIQA